MSRYYLPGENKGLTPDPRFVTESSIPIWVVVALDRSPSMWKALGEATRHECANAALLDFLKVFRRSHLKHRLRFSLVLFDSLGEIQLPIMAIDFVPNDPLKGITPNTLGCTDFYEALSTVKTLIWDSTAPLVLPWPLETLKKASNRVLVLLGGLTGKREEDQFVSSLPPAPYPTHIYLITDGEQTGCWSEKACVQLADRMKAAGVHICAQGIGDPLKFGLLRRMVSNPETDFGTHQTPESLRNAFENMAVSLIRDVE